MTMHSMICFTNHSSQTTKTLKYSRNSIRGITVSEHYSELLDNEIARQILGELYKPEFVYTLVTERDRMCVSAYDKDTGEHVDLVTGEDGIGDDYKLEEEEAELCEEGVARIKNEKDNDYTVRAFGIWKYVIPLAVVSFSVALALSIYMLLK